MLPQTLKRYIAVNILAQKDTDRIMEHVRTSPFRSFYYKLGTQLLIDSNFPTHLYLELSRTCNYRCPMCVRRESGPGGHFPSALAEKIISEAATKGPTSYSLHLFGEPLANPNWHHIIVLIRKFHPHNTVLLTTNGSLMNEMTCRKLIDLQVNRIFLSLHSLDPDLYRKNTGGGNIDDILKNIETFAQLAGRKSKTKLYLRIFTAPGQDKPDVRKLASFREMGLHYEIRGYHNYAGARKSWSTFNPSTRRWPCFHPWFTLGIAVDGRITVCCTDFSLGLEVGNAFNQSIEDVWKSEAVQSVRQEHLRNLFGRWKTCSPCDTWQFHPDIFFNFQKPSTKESYYNAEV